MLELIQEPKRIDRVLTHIALQINNEMSSRSNWTSHSEEDLFFELVRCILGSRVRYEIAEIHSRRLLSRGLLNSKKILSRPKQSAQSLSESLSCKHDKNVPRHPFSKVKTTQIIQTCRSIYQHNISLTHILHSSETPQDARTRIVAIAAGIGMKQASLFLRNIRYTDQLAIIDSHLLKFMHLRRLTQGNQFITRKKYTDYESTLRQYALSIDQPIGRVDLAIWATMRVLEREDS